MRRQGALGPAQHNADHLPSQRSIPGLPRHVNLPKVPKAGGSQILAYVVDHALRPKSSEDAASAAQLARSLGLQACPSALLAANMSLSALVGLNVDGLCSTCAAPRADH